ncbi:MAG: hypothetical protein K2X77_21620 [Candidatus Obscuribacterales bacterium]|nr:hypothetical protein [Candidatus Obscuribacterales bacterium]
MQSIDLAENTIVTINDSLSPDFVRAIEEDFPMEQRPPDWLLVDNGLKSGYLTLHELRDKESSELLSARLLANYVSRFRGDPSFALICYAVTPGGARSLQAADARRGGATCSSNTNSRQGKSKGYGTYLFHQSQKLLRDHMPNAIGLFGECESLAEDRIRPDPGAGRIESDRSKENGATSDFGETKRKRRLQWMSAIGRLQVAEYSYQIPPLPEGFDEKIFVENRSGKISDAYLLLTPFEERTFIEGNLLANIVEHLYSAGYAIAPEDPYLQVRLNEIDLEKKYMLQSLV